MCTWAGRKQSKTLKTDVSSVTIFAYFSLNYSHTPKNKSNYDKQTLFWHFMLMYGQFYSWILNGKCKQYCCWRTLQQTVPANLEATETQQKRTCAVEFDVFRNFRLDSRCDRDFLRPNTDELTSVEKSLRCSLQRVVEYINHHRRRRRHHHHRRHHPSELFLRGRIVCLVGSGVARLWSQGGHRGSGDGSPQRGPGRTLGPRWGSEG